MKSALFVRPNLKVFLLGAFLVLLVAHLICSGRSQSSLYSSALPVQARTDPKAQLRYLLEQASQHPSRHIYLQLCHYHEKQGQYRKALFFLRQAETLPAQDDFMDE